MTSTGITSPNRASEVAQPRTRLEGIQARMLVEAKQGRTIAVCIPARNESATIGGIVSAIVKQICGEIPLVDEVIVLDHDSIDSTASVAELAGARVVSTSDVAPETGPALGKGDVLWRSMLVTRADIIVWIDADLTLFDPSHVTQLVSPLLLDSRTSLVRGVHERYLNGQADEGGRVTELAARPLLKLLFPELAHIRQPLGGEYAIRRSVAERLFFEVDYGVEIGLLIDVSRMTGPESIAQVDLGPLAHRSRALSELHDQSIQIMRAMMCRLHNGSLVTAGLQREPAAHLFGGQNCSPDHAA